MDIIQQLNTIAQERDIPVEDLVRELEEALAVSYRKAVGGLGEVTVKLDTKKGWAVTVEKEVVGEVLDPSCQVSLVEALKKRPGVEIGDFVEYDVDPNRFGRIAASTAKQVLWQKLREAEHRRVHDTFSEKLGEIVSGTVQRKEESTVFLQVSKLEVELPRYEQVPTESYRPNDHLRVYVLKVEDTRRGLKVIVSRTHPNLLRKLFEAEVPEIEQGIVLIKGISREPGQRSKVAVMTTDERIDAVGACVGPRGTRVQAIVDELFDEKVDIVPWSEDAQVFITNALSPAKVNSIKLDEETRGALVVVPDSQLSLAIGKGGQNVRLAARLTEWKIDIRSETQAAEGTTSKPSGGDRERDRERERPSQ